VVYALQIDHLQRFELALISAGGELSLGELVEKHDEWLYSEPDPIDTEKAQLFAALGVAPL
jgi:hypothetical protein